MDIDEINRWGHELPKKLKDSYAHWLSRKRNIIFLRGREFRDRDCAYQHTMKSCERYNAYDKGVVSDGIAMDRLVVHDSPILNILERMETKDMMHTFLLPGGTDKEGIVLFELYRFGLTFSLEPGSEVIKCLEIAGFQLAPAQHLEGMFAGLCNYLVLENSSDASLKKVIVPFGDIKRDNDRSTRIALITKDLTPTCNDVNEEMQFFQYDIHPRFKTLEGQSISERLFLAALFAATKSIVPAYALGMTGEEQACILVRQCQLNRPFSPIELHILLNLKGLSRGKSATLSLLCHDLQRSAFEFDFLHHPSEPTAESSHMDHLDFFDDSSAYLAIRGPVSCRVLLTSCESRRTIGSVKMHSRTKTKCCNVFQLEIDECPVSRKAINSLYTSFSELWSE